MWRVEAKKVLMFNHEPFEDYLDYLPSRQLALVDLSPSRISGSSSSAMRTIATAPSTPFEPPRCSSIS